MNNLYPLQPRRWNLFARELEDVLAAHKVGLSQLFHRTTFNPAIVARLRQSLIQKYPKHFPILTREQLEEVITCFQLNEEEQIRLRAAILATGVERILMDRLDPDNALLATDQIFPVILNAMRTLPLEIGGLGVLRKGEETDDDQNGEDTTFDLIFDALDRASLALHMSFETASSQERILRARQAYEGFLVALHELESLPATSKMTEEWQVWYQEVQQGIVESQQRLDLLEK